MAQGKPDKRRNGFSRRAFSLIEVLIGLAVFAFLAALITGAFVLAHRYSRLNQRVSQAHRNLAQGLRSLGDDLRRSAAPSLGPSWNNLDHVVMLSWQPGLAYHPSSAEVLYRTWIGYWRTGSGEIRRSQLPLGGGPNPLIMVDFSVAPTLTALQAAQPQRLVADHISLFRVERASNLATVEMECRTSTAGNPDTHLRLRTCIPMR